MASGFTFSFGGDDIEDDAHRESQDPQDPHGASGLSLEPQIKKPEPVAAAGAFPVAGKPQLPPTHHDMNNMLSRLPSKVAYGLLDLGQDGLNLPRRELWDVKVQVMAEQDLDADLEPGLGTHDVKTGVYEGGFKSWESSVDLVKEILRLNPLGTCLPRGQALRVVELGCGTALPSMAILQAIASSKEVRGNVPVHFTVADYNPTVLQLVTFPNIILTWALATRGETPIVDEAFDGGEELEFTPKLVDSFRRFLANSKISFSFLSGGWSEEFVSLLSETTPGNGTSVRPEGSGDMMTLILGAETIYSPFALATFTDTMISILKVERGRENSGQALAIVAAKRHYFGVGGSLDDFIERTTKSGCEVKWLREEGQGVRRGVVLCQLA